jgi:PAS domain S-box-containing protein
MGADAVDVQDGLRLRVQTLERALAEARAKIDQQEQMLQAGFAATLVSKELGQLATDELDDGIERMLAAFSPQIAASSATLWLYSIDGKRAEATHAWPPGSKPAPLAVADVAWSSARMQSLETIQVTSASELPEEPARERSLFAQYGNAVMLAVPLVHRGRTIGGLSFARASDSTPFDDAQVALARMVADVFAAALERRRSSQEWARLFDCLRAFGADARANVDRLTALAGELLGADCGIYHRLEQGRLCAAACWRTPVDFVPYGAPERAVGGQVLLDSSDRLRVARDLQSSPWVEIDPNVGRHGVRTVVSRGISIDGARVGALCLAYQRDFEPTSDQARLFEAIADGIAVEEVRRRAQEQLRQTLSVLEATLESTADGIFVADVAANPIRQNRRFFEMWGIPAERWADHDFCARHRLQQVRDPFDFMVKVADLYGDPTRHDLSNVELSDGRIFERYSRPLLVDEQLRGRVWSFRDVTERARRDAELRHALAMLEATLESTADGIVVGDEHGSPLRENARLREMWRTSADDENPEDRGRQRLAMVKDPDAFVRGLLALYADRESELSATVELNDGRVFERRSVPLRVDGVHRGRVTSYHDVTELVRRESELRHALALLEATLEATADGILVVDPRGRPLRHNRHFLEVWRVPDAVAADGPLPAMTWAMERLRGGADEHLQGFQALAADPDVREFTRHDLTDGTVVERYSIPLHAFGEHLGRVFSFRDVTERARAEAARALLATAVEQAGEGVLITDRAGRIEYVNPTFERMSGFRLDELRDRTPRVLKSGRHGDETYRAIWETIAQGLTWSGRLVNRRADGTLCEVDEVIAPVRASGGAITKFVAILRDVTREHQLEEDARQAQKMEAVGRLAGGIAHDFNNLLTAIIGYVEVVEEALPVGDRAIADVREIRTAAERAAALTRQLLAFSRRQLLQPRVLDLNRVVCGMENMLRRLIPENVEIRLSLAEEIGSIRADPSQLEQVVLNLALNARDAIEGAGHVTIATAALMLERPTLIGHDALPPGRYARLSVTDDGHGMDATTLDRVFEPFFTTKGLGRGTGLGLATVYGIVRQSGGAIAVESQPGRGARFEITLPLASEDEPPVSRPARAPRPSRARTILLVEDEPAVRAVAARVLRASGHRVMEAADGLDALELFAAHAAEIDALVTDVVMPRMSGPELVRRACVSRPALPVLFMSGHVDAAVDGLELPAAAAFLPKPFEPEALRRALSDLFEPRGR